MFVWARKIIQRNRRTDARQATDAPRPARQPAASPSARQRSLPVSAGRPAAIQPESLRVPVDRFPELWRAVIAELKAIVGRYNTDASATLVTLQVGTGDSISIRKPSFPASYLDLMPQPGTASCTVRFEFYRSQSSTPRIAEETDRCQPRGAGLAICRHGRPLTAAQFASEMMELFFEGV